MSTDLYGHGGLRNLRTADWCACLHLALIFGWDPGPELDSDCPELCNYCVSDEDARALALALYRAIHAIESGAEQSPETKKCLREVGTMELARSVADYAIVGGFGVG